MEVVDVVGTIFILLMCQYQMLNTHVFTTALKRELILVSVQIAAFDGLFVANVTLSIFYDSPFLSGGISILYNDAFTRLVVFIQKLQNFIMIKDFLVLPLFLLYLVVLVCVNFLDTG